MNSVLKEDFYAQERCQLETNGNSSPLLTHGICTTWVLAILSTHTDIFHLSLAVSQNNRYLRIHFPALQYGENARQL